MNYDVFRFGALYLDHKVQHIPEKPIERGDIPQYKGKLSISFGAAVLGKTITWIKPRNLNLLIADRTLLANVGWEDLNKNGFTTGKTVLIDGQHFRCRLLRVGEDRNIPNEWDKVLDETSESNTLWNWEKMFFWGADVSTYGSAHSVRGYVSARNWAQSNAWSKDSFIGFRPVLEPLGTAKNTPNCKLDGEDFQSTSLSGSDTFCPILQPIQKSVFKDIPAGSKVRMYAFTENGRPIHMNEQVKDPAKLTLTDRYYGDEFLVPWTISNGVAVADQTFQ